MGIKLAYLILSMCVCVRVWPFPNIASYGKKLVFWALRAWHSWCLESVSFHPMPQKAVKAYSSPLLPGVPIWPARDPEWLTSAQSSKVPHDSLHLQKSRECLPIQTGKQWKTATKTVGFGSYPEIHCLAFSCALSYAFQKTATIVKIEKCAWCIQRTHKYTYIHWLVIIDFVMMTFWWFMRIHGIYTIVKHSVP